MPILLLILLATPLFAKSTHDIKEGIAFSFGSILSKSEFPSQFQGKTKNKVDQTATLFGPVLNLGYDIILREKFILGVRTEGFVADTLGTGAKRNKERTDKTTGKISSLGLALRGGYIFNFRSHNPLGDKFDILTEVFMECGFSRGSKIFEVDYSYNDGTLQENYKESLREYYSANQLALGVNLNSGNGGFVELKVLQTSMLSNTQDFKGSQVINGAAPVPTNKYHEDENRKSFTSLLLLIGYHY